MKRLLLFIGIFMTSLTLVACGESEVELTPPTFNSVTIDGVDPVADGSFVRFYKAKNEISLVGISITNPDNVEVTSIKINGVNFRNARFTEDSTSTMIYFEMNSGINLASTIYSVDEIVYKDGDISKSTVISAGSGNEFELYVYKDTPTVERDSFMQGKDSVEIWLEIDDPDKVINAGTLVATLHSGEVSYGEQDITTGDISVLFEDLPSDKLYEMKIIASFDLDNGEGLQLQRVLYSEPIKTLKNSIPSATIIDPVVSSNSVSFNVGYTDEDNVTVPGGLSVALYKEGEENAVDAFEITGSEDLLQFDGLLNDNTYTIKVLSDFDLRNALEINENYELASYTFTTLPMSVPTPEILNLQLEENRILFDVRIDDPNGIINESTLMAYIYVEGELIDSATINDYAVDLQVYNVFSNYEFEIAIEATYNLNNGDGDQQGEIFRETYNTLQNSIPTVNVSDVVVSQGYVTLILDATDPNQTLKSPFAATLYRGEEVLGEVFFGTDDSTIVIPYLVRYDEVYEITITADYNLRDGNGTVYDEVLFRSVLLSLEPKAPVAEIKNVVQGKDFLTMDIDILDADETIVDGTVFANIYLGEDIVEFIELTIGENDAVTFNNELLGLLSNNEYYIEIIADYNLQDGSGVQTTQVLQTAMIMTLEREVPTAEIINQESTTEEIIFDLDITDVDTVITAGTLRADLFLDGAFVTSNALPDGVDVFDIEFSGLFSDTIYDVVVYANYNLNDGAGEFTDHIIAEFSIRTKAKAVPTANISDVSTTENSILFDVFIEDDDGVLIGDAYAELYIDDIPQGVTITLDEGLNTSESFTGLLANQRYSIRVFADYNLNDQESTLEDQLLDFQFATTFAYEAPTAELYDVVQDGTEVTFNVVVTDADNVITPLTLVAALFEGETEIDTITLNNGDNINKSFTNLDANTEYQIIVRASYNLLDVQGPQTDIELDSASFATRALFAPTVAYRNIVASYDEITLDIEINDLDGTDVANAYAELYDGAVLLTTVPLNDDLTVDVNFDTLFSNYEYRIEVYADYNLQDGEGVLPAELIGSVNISTIEKQLPTILVTSSEITATEVIVTFSVSDVNEVLLPNTLEAQLIIDDVVVAQKTLFTNQVTFNIANLVADYPFSIQLIGDYDLDDNNGVQTDQPIAELELQTIANEIPTATFSDVAIKQNSVDATITVTDDDTVISTNTLFATLYDSTDTPVGLPQALDVGVNSVSFAQELAIDALYYIVVEADYNLLDGNGAHTDQKLAQYLVYLNYSRLPEATISNENHTATSIVFDVFIDDNDAITTGDAKALLYVDGSLHATEPLDVETLETVTFSVPNSNYEYYVTISVDYDLSNNNGVIDDYIMKVATLATLAKAVPTATIDSTDADNTSIDFNYTLTDDDTAIVGFANAVLYKDGATTGDVVQLSTGSNSGSFTDLDFGAEYTIKIETDYDLNDTETTESGAVLASSDAETVALVSTSDILEDKKQVNFTFTIDDQFSILTGLELRITLFDDTDTQVGEIYITESGEVELYDLFSGKEYTIKVAATDPGNADAVVYQDVYQETFTTLPLAQPLFEFDLDEATTASGASLDIDISATTDEDNIIQGNLVASLYRDGVLVSSQTVTLNTDTSLTWAVDVTDGATYIVVIEADVNLNDGAGNQTGYALDQIIIILSDD